MSENDSDKKIRSAKRSGIVNHEEKRRAAANRLMDVITDLDDDLVLAADRQTPEQRTGEGTKGFSQRRWIAVGISVAALVVAGLLALGFYLGRPGKDDRPSDGVTTEAGATEAGATEAGITEAGVTEAGVTEEGITESGVTETGISEAEVTEAVTEAGVTEAGGEVPTESNIADDLLRERAKHDYNCVDVKTVSFESLKEMEEYADVILRAVRLDQEEPVVSGPYTFSQVKISRIYKDTTGQLAEDQEITVLENEVYDVERDTICHVAGYNMMVAGEEYLLFLTHNELPGGREYYTACGVNFGTISTTEDGRDRFYGSGGRKAYEEYLQDPVLKEIWEEAKYKYQ